jgi:general secretion pathway protein K
MSIARTAAANQRGLALLMVLWTLMLLSMLAVGFAQQTRLELQRVGNVIGDAKASANLQAGLSLGIAALLDSARTPGWIHDGSPHELAVDGKRLTVAIQDANGCLDLNKAESAQLQALLRAIGLKADDARALAAAIVDWRDSDSFTTPNGAEMSAYMDAGAAVGPANRPFLSVAELSGVLGMTPEIADRLSPLVTILASGQEVNPLTAPEPILRATVPEEEIPAILARRAARAEKKEQPKNAISLSKIEPTDLRSASDEDLVEVAEGPIYLIDVTATVQDGKSLRGRAVVWLTQEAKRPYEILDWQLLQTATGLDADRR